MDKRIIIENIDVVDHHPYRHITIIVDNQERHQKKRKKNQRKKIEEKTNDQISIIFPSFVYTRLILFKIRSINTCI
jgi:hypothetical protein